MTERRVKRTDVLGYFASTKISCAWVCHSTTNAFERREEKNKHLHILRKRLRCAQNV